MSELLLKRARHGFRCGCRCDQQHPEHGLHPDCAGWVAADDLYVEHPWHAQAADPARYCLDCAENPLPAGTTTGL